MVNKCSKILYKLRSFFQNTRQRNILDLEFRRLKSFAVQNEFTFEELEQFVGDGYDVFDIAIELANFVINGTLKQFVRVKNVGDFDSMLDLHDDTNIDDIRIMYKVNDRKLCTE